MGQFLDLHAQLQTMLEGVKSTVPEQRLRIYADPPVELPELPCVFALTPDSDYQNVDTIQGQDIATVVVRLLVDARRPQTELLEHIDYLAGYIDVWLSNTHPAPIDQARRLGMRGVNPVFGEVVTRGADFPIRIELAFRQIHPAP